jgi:hypothetical protein
MPDTRLGQRSRMSPDWTRQHGVERSYDFGYVPRASRLRARAVSYSSPVIRTTPIRKPAAA